MLSFGGEREWRVGVSFYDCVLSVVDSLISNLRRSAANLDVSLATRGEEPGIERDEPDLEPNAEEAMVRRERSAQLHQQLVDECRGNPKVSRIIDAVYDGAWSPEEVAEDSGLDYQTVTVGIRQLRRRGSEIAAGWTRQDP